MRSLECNPIISEPVGYGCSEVEDGITLYEMNAGLHQIMHCIFSRVIAQGNAKLELLPA